MLVVQAAGHTCMIDIYKIFAIESSNNPLAWDKTDDSRGLGQITPGVLNDYNKAHKTNFKPNDLFKEEINTKITDWYANTEIPRLLEAFGIEDTDEHRITAYNAGIGRLSNIIKNNLELPEITSDYIIKYKMGGDIKAGQIKLKELGFDPGKIDGKFGPNTRKAFLDFQNSTMEAPVVQRNSGIQTLKR